MSIKGIVLDSNDEELNIDDDQTRNIRFLASETFDLQRRPLNRREIIFKTSWYYVEQSWLNYDNLACWLSVVMTIQWNKLLVCRDHHLFHSSSFLSYLLNFYHTAHNSSRSAWYIPSFSYLVLFSLKLYISYRWDSTSTLTIKSVHHFCRSLRIVNISNSLFTLITSYVIIPLIIDSNRCSRRGPDIPNMLPGLIACLVSIRHPSTQICCAKHFRHRRAVGFSSWMYIADMLPSSPGGQVPICISRAFRLVFVYENIEGIMLIAITCWYQLVWQH